MDDYLIAIPARGGSKRLPRKNLIELSGKPLLNWTIECALNSQLKGQIVVTSDDEDILNCARQYESMGVECQKRPEHLATDASSTASVLLHLLKSGTIENKIPRAVVLLQPTSPLRAPEDLLAAVKLFERTNKRHTIVTVCKVDHPSSWIGTVDQHQQLQGVELSGKRSQDYEQEYRLNGAVYVIPTEHLLTTESIFTAEVYSSIMPRLRSIDIDSFFDLKLATTIIREYIPDQL